MKKLTMAAMAILFCLSGAASAQSARRSSSMSSTHHETFLVSTELEFGMPVGNSADQNDLKFGTGIGVGYAMKQWNARINVHTQSVGDFADALMITAGVGYQFAGF